MKKLILVVVLTLIASIAVAQQLTRASVLQQYISTLVSKNDVDTIVTFSQQSNATQNVTLKAFAQAQGSDLQQQIQGHQGAITNIIPQATAIANFVSTPQPTQTP